MNDLYGLLKHVQSERQNSWIGNLRWIVNEDQSCPKAWNFLTAPMDSYHARGRVCSVKDLLHLSINNSGSNKMFEYRPDELISEYESASVSIVMPYDQYGAIIIADSKTAELEIKAFGEYTFIERDNEIIINNSGYYICLISSSKMIIDESLIRISLNEKTKLAVAFYNDIEKAEDICHTLFQDTDRIRSDSAAQWDRYLQSCPIHKVSAELKRCYDAEKLKTRQLWHWCIALANVSDVEFNGCKTYLAPDRSVWFGSWSNDSPEALAAISLTSAAPLARKAIIEYVRCAISENGIHSWYTHADGRAAFGIKNDPGRFSHGVLCIIHTVDYYIRATGDESILLEDVGESTVWEKLKTYFLSVFDSRDINHDGLLECMNLWESGWDDKISPFFEKKSLEEWVEVVTKGTDDEINKFYEENCQPITPVVEQVHGLWAIRSMELLSIVMKDDNLNELCVQHYRHMLDSVRDRLWNPSTGFYHDRDVKRDNLVNSMNMDAFYFLYFEKEPQRISSMIKILRDPRKFGLKYTPSTASDDPKYSPLGYWSGGYWPREMSYVGMGLYETGDTLSAEKIILDALMCGEGNKIHETVNPETGISTTSPVRLAYGSVLIAALMHIEGHDRWS